MAKLEHSLNPSNNYLLSRLPLEHYERLRPHLQLVELALKQGIYEPNVPIRHAYFPEQGMISVVSLMQDGNSIEVGTIGQEGMAGTELLLDSASTPYQFFVQIPGHAQRIEGALLKAEVERSADLRKVLNRYQSIYLLQMMQSVACNGLHSIPQRCCRWLLIARDRAKTDDMKLTHEFLGLMLGVRRASVTDVLRPLQDAGLVRSNHGTISILNREGLESGACECYRVVVERQKQSLNG